jgi:enolase-phosphatase E1
VTISLRERGVRGLVLDIEGTTTPVSFVYDVLFPYAREHLPSYVASHTGQLELEESVLLLRKEWEDDVARRTDPPVRESPRWIVDYALWLMQQDRKSPGLKLLQGLIWQGGYADGSLRGDVYPDVPPALARWRDDGLAAAIYSSGSVLAQRLLFSTTAFGDLTRFIAQYFDTAVGPKREAESYGRIAAAMSLPPDRLLFVSDVTAELEAARGAGMQVVHCVRDATESTRDAVHSFDEIV